jgi:hypothetical protein
VTGNRDLVEGEVSSDQLSENLHRSFIFPTFDSVRWKEETERVAPSLKASMKEKSRGSISWSSNIETLRRYTSQANSSENGGEEVDISTVSLVELVSLLQRNLLEGLSGISRGESLMNSNSALSALAVEYAGLHEVCLFCSLAHSSSSFLTSSPVETGSSRGETERMHENCLQ